jgi:hypothetical protein
MPHGASPIARAVRGVDHDVTHLSEPTDGARNGPAPPYARPEESDGPSSDLMKIVARICKAQCDGVPSAEV